MSKLRNIDGLAPLPRLFAHFARQLRRWRGRETFADRMNQLISEQQPKIKAAEDAIEAAYAFVGDLSADTTRCERDLQELLQRLSQSHKEGNKELTSKLAARVGKKRHDLEAKRSTLLSAKTQQERNRTILDHYLQNIRDAELEIRRLEVEQQLATTSRAAAEFQKSINLEVGDSMSMNIRIASNNVELAMQEMQARTDLAESLSVEVKLTEEETQEIVQKAFSSEFLD